MLNFFMPLAHSEGFGLNTNILETNIINLAAVFALLAYVGVDFVSSLLKNRKESILKSLRDADERYQDAVNQLKQALQELENARTNATEIRRQGEINAEAVRQRLAAFTQEEMARLEEAKQTIIKLEEEKAVAEVCGKAISEALVRAEKKIVSSMDDSMHRRVMDMYLNLLSQIH
jgi:F-type H+-transporting ATPase subunit b